MYSTTRHRGRPTFDPGRESRQRGAHREGHQQEKTDSDHQTEGTSTIQKEICRAEAWHWFNTPNRVQGCLQFEEGATRREHQRDPADDRGHEVFLTTGGSLQERLHSHSAVWPHQGIDLARELTADCLGSKQGPGYRDRHEENRGDREQRVVGHRGAKAQGVVVPPGDQRTAQDPKDAHAKTSKRRFVLYRAAVWFEPMASPDTMISTRRFCCRPAAVSLVATGRSSPTPNVTIAAGAIR